MDIAFTNKLLVGMHMSCHHTLPVIPLRAVHVYTITTRQTNAFRCSHPYCLRSSVPATPEKTFSRMADIVLDSP